MADIRELIVTEVKQYNVDIPEELLYTLEHVLIGEVQARIKNADDSKLNNIKQRHAEEVRELRDKLETQDSIRAKYQNTEDRLEERNKKQNEHIGKLSSEISVLIRQVKKLEERGPVSMQEHDSLLEERDFLRELALSNATGERI